MKKTEFVIRSLLEFFKLTHVEFSLKTDIKLPTLRKYLRSAFNITPKNISIIENVFLIEISKILNLEEITLETLEELEYSYKIEFKEIKKKNEDFVEFTTLLRYRTALEESNNNYFRKKTTPLPDKVSYDSLKKNYPELFYEFFHSSHDTDSFEFNNILFFETLKKIEEKEIFLNNTIQFINF